MAANHGRWGEGGMTSRDQVADEGGATDGPSTIDKGPMVDGAAKPDDGVVNEKGAASDPLAMPDEAASDESAMGDTCAAADIGELADNSVLPEDFVAALEDGGIDGGEDPEESRLSSLIDDLRNARGRFGPDWRKREEAATKLGELGGEDALGHLIAVLDEVKKGGLSEAIIGVLGQAGGVEAVQALSRLLADPSRRKQHAAAVEALERIGGMDAIRVLATVLPDLEHRKLHTRVVGILMRMEDEAAAIALEQASSDPLSRAVLVASLRRDMLKASQLMVRPDWEQRVMAARGLGVLRAAEAVDDMAEALAKHKEPRLWEAVTGALTRIGDERAARALVGGWRWADVTQAATVREALVSLGVELTDQPLIDALQDSDQAVREAAWGLLSETDVLARLVEMLEDEDRQRQARERLVQIGEPSTPKLLAALGHEDGAVRRLAASALLEIGAPDIEPLRDVLALWEQATETPRAARVAAGDGSGDYTSLEEAVAAAVPGGIIWLADGDHWLETPLKVDGALALRGEGMDNSRIVGYGDGCLVGLYGSGPFCAADLAFENKGSTPASVVEVDGGEISLLRCRFVGGTEKETEEKEPPLDEPEGEVEEQPVTREAEAAQEVEVIQESALEGSGLGNEERSEVDAGHNLRNVDGGLPVGAGLRMLGQTRGTVLDCEFLGNAHAGILLLGEAQPGLERNVCRENWAGIMYFGSTAGVARQNLCAQNAFVGIGASYESRPVLEANTCEHSPQCILVNRESEVTLQGNICRNGTVGIAFWGSSSGTARGNRCTACVLSGIDVSFHAKPVLEENQCQDNGIGIQYGGEAAGTARGNQVIENSATGIIVGEQARPNLEGNTARGNKSGGIAYADEAAGVCRQNECLGNEYNGIQAADQSSPLVEDNRCEENSGAGLLVSDLANPDLRGNRSLKNLAGISYAGTAAGTAERNHCEINKDHGIYVEGEAHPSLRENTCEKNRRSGIAYFDSAAGMAMKNRCLANRESGILIADQAQPTVEENICRGNGVNGIHVGGAATGTARRNECVSNGRNGITVQDGARPMLEENECRKNKGSGIMYVGAGSGVARKNRCNDNEEYGILVMGSGADPDLQDNKFKGNKNRDVFHIRHVNIV